MSDAKSKAVEKAKAKAPSQEAPKGSYVEQPSLAKIAAVFLLTAAVAAIVAFAVKLSQDYLVQKAALQAQYWNGLTKDLTQSLIKSLAGSSGGASESQKAEL